MGTTRRQAIAVTGAAGAAYLLARSGAGSVLDTGAAAQTTPQCVLTGSRTEGPFFNDEKLNRSDIRVEPSTGEAVPGIPLVLSFVVLDSRSCAPIAGAQVDVWHCNASGDYSGERANNSGSGVGSTAGLKYLRGYQVTDAEGRCTFTTVFPGWYAGRTVHIHFKIRSGNDEFVSQLFFEESTVASVQSTDHYRGNDGRVDNASDGLYGKDGASLVVDLTGDNTNGYAGTFTVGLSGFESGPGSEQPDSVVAAAIGRTRFERTRSGGRTLVFEIAARERLELVASLQRRRRSIAKAERVTIASGSRIVRLAVPRRATTGPARLQVALTDAAGNTRTLAKKVNVPRRRGR